MNRGPNQLPMRRRVWTGFASTGLASTGLALLASLILGGCMGRPARIDAPDWDPDQSADQAITDLDRDGDGLLSMEELSAAPGLKYNAKGLDAEGDNDGKLSRDEIYARVKLYQDSRTGLKAFSCSVRLDKRPLSGATVRLVPEPFLGNALEPNEGISDRGGQVRFQAEGFNMSLAKIGMYKVEITSANVKIPAIYNSATTLGLEIPPVTDPYHQGPVVFHLKTKK